MTEQRTLAAKPRHSGASAVLPSRRLAPASGGVAIAGILAALLLGASAFGTLAQAANAPDPTGVWLTQPKDARILISRCAEKLCGKVVWLKKPLDRRTLQPQRDVRNMNLAHTRRMVVGLKLFSGMKSVGSNKWTGRVYNVRDGRAYPSTLVVLTPTSMKLSGCQGGICQSEIWSRPDTVVAQPAKSPAETTDTPPEPAKAPDEPAK